MLLFTDGFDHYALAAETTANVTSYLQAAGYVVTNASLNTLNLLAGQDAGSLGVKLTIGAGVANPPSFAYSVTTTAMLTVFGFSFRGKTSRQRVARINGTIDLDWDVTTGKLKIGSTFGADVIILNAFWFIEIEIDKTANELRVWANDVLQLTIVLPGGIGDTHTISWGIQATSATAATIEIDDFYVVDNSAGQNITRLGPVQMITRAPTSDIATEWTPVGSAGSHASIAAQLSPGAVNAPYLQANIEGKIDKFASTVVLPNDNQIFGVALVAYCRKGDLDNRNLGMTVSTTGGSLELQTPLTTGFLFKQTVFEQAPGGVVWNQNRVESSNFGIVAR